MFIVRDGIGYEVTRKNVVTVLEEQVQQNLSALFTGHLLKKAVKEFIDNLEFPGIINTDSILFYNTNEYVEYVIQGKITKTGEIYTIKNIAPVYKGFTIPEIVQVLEDIESVLLSCKHCINPLFVKTENTLVLKTFDQGYFSDIKDVLNTYFSKEFSDEIFTKIYKKIFMTGEFYLLINGELFYLDTNQNCEKCRFEATYLKDEIVGLLPNLMVLENVSNQIATFIHNRILFNSKLKFYELKRPSYKDGIPFFIRTIGEIEYYLDIQQSIWVAVNPIQVRIEELEWVDCKDTKWSQIAFYKQHPIFSLSSNFKEKGTYLRRLRNWSIAYNSYLYTVIKDGDVRIWQELKPDDLVEIFPTLGDK